MRKVLFHFNFVLFCFSGKLSSKHLVVLARKTVANPHGFVDVRVSCHYLFFSSMSYLVLGFCSFLLCQEDKGTTKKFFTVELSCGRTAVGTFMSYSQIKVD